MKELRLGRIGEPERALEFPPRNSGERQCSPELWNRLAVSMRESYREALTDPIGRKTMKRLTDKQKQQAEAKFDKLVLEWKKRMSPVEIIATLKYQTWRLEVAHKSFDRQQSTAGLNNRGGEC
jgi:hypothetical protein